MAIGHPLKYWTIHTIHMNIEIGATDIYHNVVIETYYLMRVTWLCKYAHKIIAVYSDVHRFEHIIVVIKKSQYIFKDFSIVSSMKYLICTV